MKLKAKKYTVFNLLPSLIGIAPVAMTASLLANVLIGIIPVVSALATAWFIDSALALVAGTKAMGDMALPILAAFGMQAVDYCRWEIDNYAGHSVRRSLLVYYRPAIAAKVAALDYKYIEDGKTWDLISRMSDSPHRKMYSILDGVIYLLQLLVGMAGVVLLVAMNVWWAALLFGLCLVPTIWISIKLGGKTYAEKAQVERNKRRFYELERVCLDRECVEERATFGYSEEEVRQYEAEYGRAYKSLFQFWKKREITTSAVQACFAIVTVAVAVILAFPVISGAMTLGTMVAVVREVLSLQSRMGSLSYCMMSIGEGKGYAKELTEFAALPETEGALDDPASPPVAFESLEFKHVTFAYPGTERKILEDFSLTLERGKHYAFVGVNGAGKTTMTKLICGLYDQFEGEILLNGRDIRSYSQAELKSLCAPIFQDFARFQVPMRDSIALGVKGREERLEGVIHAIGLDETVSKLPQGLDTPLGKAYEGGQDLSGGQWQRVAIARALVSDAPLRILDEPTAALDPVSESEFYESFAGLSQGVTTIFISHRLGSTKLADRIFVLDGGRIAEEGTRDELIAKNGLYAEMFEAQRSWYV